MGMIALGERTQVGMLVGMLAMVGTTRAAMNEPGSREQYTAAIGSAALVGGAGVVAHMGSGHRFTGAIALGGAAGALLGAGLGHVLDDTLPDGMIMAPGPLGDAVTGADAI